MLSDLRGEILVIALIIAASLAVGFSIQFGIAPILFLLGAVAVLNSIATSVRPQLYLLGFIASISAVVPTAVLGFSIRQGFTLNFWDLYILFAAFLPWFIRRMILPGKKDLSSLRKSLVPFLSVMLAWATISLIYGLYIGNSYHMAIGMYRPYLYSAVICLMIANEIKTKGQLERMVIFWLLGAAIVGPLAILLKAVLGDTSVLWPDLWDNTGQTLAGTTRLIYTAARPGAFGLLVLCALYLKKQITSAKAVLLAAGMFIAVMMNLGRAQYIAIFMGFFFLLLIARDGPVFRSWTIVLGVVLGLISLSFLLNSVSSVYLTGNVAMSLMDRFVSGFNIRDPNMQGRILEASLAWKDIQVQPIFGTGLGGMRSSVVSPGESAQSGWGYYYIHNAYVMAALQGGIPMMLLTMLYAITLLVKSLSACRHLQDRFQKGLAMGICVSVVAMAIIALTGPEFQTGSIEVSLIAALWAGWLSVLPENKQNGRPSPCG